MLKVESNKISYWSCWFFLTVSYEFLNWVVENAEILFLVEYIIVVDVDKGPTGIQGEVMIVVEAPFGKLSELL